MQKVSEHAHHSNKRFMSYKSTSGILNAHEDVFRERYC